MALDEPSRAIPSWALPHALPLQPLPQQPWAWKPEQDRGVGAHFPRPCPLQKLCLAFRNQGWAGREGCSGVPTCCSLWGRAPRLPPFPVCLRCPRLTGTVRAVSQQPWSPGGLSPRDGEGVKGQSPGVVG